MNADRMHGFCEGMAVAVGIAALGFVVIKEVDAFYKRHAAVRSAHNMWSSRAEAFRDAALAETATDFRITSNGPMNESQMRDLIGHLLLDAHSSETDGQLREGTGENEMSSEELAEALSGPDS